MATSTSRRRGTAQRTRTATQAGADAAGADLVATDAADVEVTSSGTGTEVTGTVSGDAGPGEPEGVECTVTANGWADVVPLIALRSGTRPTSAEVRFALPVWAELTGGGDPRTAMQVGAAVELAGHPGVDGADVKRILNRFERAGIAVLDSGGPVPRWSAAHPEDIVRDATRPPHGDGADGLGGARSDARAGAGSSGRMVAGGLRGLVEDFLADHPGEDFGAAGIARELGRSSGAVANSLAKLAESGAIEQTGAAPLRYRHRPEDNAATTGADDMTGTGDGTGDGESVDDAASPERGDHGADAQ